jgi:FkbM family methyltransferase
MRLSDRISWPPQKPLRHESMFSQHVFTFPVYVPRVLLLFRNWPLYLKNYLFRKKEAADYQFRNGLRLRDTAGTLAGTIAVVFIRREYGILGDFGTIIDIGANMGCFAIYAAGGATRARVFCFEPEGRNFAALRQNIALNALDGRVFPFQSAVAESSERREMVIGESPLNSLMPDFTEGKTQMVECTTLQQIMATNALETVDLLKVNCEGAEYEILGKCSQDVFQRIHRIRVEYHNLKGPNENGDGLATLLRNRGYKIERFTRYKKVSGFIWATR